MLKLYIVEILVLSRLFFIFILLYFIYMQCSGILEKQHSSRLYPHRSKNRIDKSQKPIHQFSSKFYEGHLKVPGLIFFCYFFDKNLITKVSISIFAQGRDRLKIQKSIFLIVGNIIVEFFCESKYDVLFDIQ